MFFVTKINSQLNFPKSAWKRHSGKSACSNGRADAVLGSPGTQYGYDVNQYYNGQSRVESSAPKDRRWTESVTGRGRILHDLIKSCISSRGHYHTIVSTPGTKGDVIQISWANFQDRAFLPVQYLSCESRKLLIHFWGVLDRTYKSFVTFQLQINLQNMTEWRSQDPA